MLLKADQHQAGNVSPKHWGKKDAGAEIAVAAKVFWKTDLFANLTC
jgi:hypothetical protein